VVNHPLNRGRKASALLRFVKWQIGSRLVPGAVVFDWVGDSKIIIRPGDRGLTQNIYCGLHDFREMAYLLHVLTDLDLFVDIGANAGSYTVLACAVRGAKGYCFEPVPSTFVRLMDNLTVNNLSDRVTPLNLGISDKEGELRFTVGAGTTNHVATEMDESAGLLSVPVRTLDQALAGESPSLIKVDVEGFELPVLNGAVATLANPSLHSIVIELNGSGSRYGFDEGEIVRQLNGWGFFSYLYEPLTRELRPISGKNTAGDNTLFVRNADAVRERLNLAPRIQVGSVEI
jgi:FkbM family methyltransferase